MKLKVLFLTGQLRHYRIPILNLIIKKSGIDLTVAHSGKIMKDDSFLFKEIILKEDSIGPFTYHDKNFFDFCNSFDIVVAMLYLQKLSFMKLLFNRRRKFKLVYWGIGVKASQNSQFDSPTFLNKIRYFIAKKSDAMIFYTDYAKDKYIAKGVDRHKLFVMNNTVEIINKLSQSYKRDRVLFVGTLNKSKKIFSLLSSYLKAYNINKKLPRIDIIGDGADYEGVKKWIIENKLEKIIFAHGAIYDSLELERFYKKALVCISPGQAGLSVLSSFGYAVPFITSIDAITGGERLNIKNDYNGVLFNSEDQLKDIIIDIANNRDKYLKMGTNAHNYYLNERSPDIMADGFIDAINYVKKMK